MAGSFAEYNATYQKENIILKRIKFNRQNAEDMAMLDWVNLQENFTCYVKSLIRADMMKEPQTEYQIVRE